MEKAQYYLIGLYQGAFKQNSDLSAVTSAIVAIHQGNLRSGFDLVEKYKFSKDLRPEVFTYDPAFVDILFSNDIPGLLKNVVGRDLCLVHIQLRISYSSGRSYMSWHRDTHAYGDNLVGNMPPVHKIIFYPTVGGKIDEKIRVIPGSHRQVFSNKYLDYLHILFSKKKTVKSSDSEFMLFNTELFHHVVPESDREGSFRLIYTFAEKEQLEKYKEGRPLIDLYQEKLRLIAESHS